MALTLPTITINDDLKAQRLMNAFKLPGMTEAEAAHEYREWLKRVLINEVIRREAQALMQEANDKRTELANMMSDI